MSESEDAPMNSNDETLAGCPAWELPGELKSIEARLAALSPRDDRLDRERLMFLAGQSSVAPASQQHRRILGVPLDARIWPPAFAGMTAVAATLLVLLLSRPAVVEPPATRVRDVATSTRPTESPHAVRDDRISTRDDVLSTSDALHRDLERLLATRVAPPRDVNAAVGMPSHEPLRPTLTPAAWRQVFNGSELPGQPSNDSSSLSTFRGITS